MDFWKASLFAKTYRKTACVICRMFRFSILRYVEAFRIILLYRIEAVPYRKLADRCSLPTSTNCACNSQDQLFGKLI